MAIDGYLSGLTSAFLTLFDLMQIMTHIRLMFEWNLKPQGASCLFLHLWTHVLPLRVVQTGNCHTSCLSSAQLCACVCIFKWALLLVSDSICIWKPIKVQSHLPLFWYPVISTEPLNGPLQKNIYIYRLSRAHEELSHMHVKLILCSRARNRFLWACEILAQYGCVHCPVCQV